MTGSFSKLASPVLHVVAAGEIGGAERMLMDLVADQSARTHTIALFTPNPKLRALFAKTGVAIDDRGESVREGPLPFLSSTLGQSDVKWLAEVITRRGAKIVHLHTFASQVLGTRAALRAGAKVIRTEHSTRVYDDPTCWPFSKWSLARTDEVVCISHHVRRRATQKSPHPMTVIHNGVDINHFQPPTPTPSPHATQVAANQTPPTNPSTHDPANARDASDPVGALNMHATQMSDASSSHAQPANPSSPHPHPANSNPSSHAHPTNPTRFVALGRLDARKGIDLALRALVLVRDATLDVVGDGEERASLEALSSSLGLRERVTFSGYADDVRGSIARADVVLSSAREEGLGIALLEAMAMGRPVVGVPVGGVVEIVVEGETGWMADARTPEALARVMQRAASSADERTARGRKSRERVVNHFSIGAMRDGYEQVYRRLSS